MHVQAYLAVRLGHTLDLSSAIEVGEVLLSARAACLPARRPRCERDPVFSVPSALPVERQRIYGRQSLISRL